VLVVGAIQGLGGIGKSLLATSLTHEKAVQEHFPEFQLFTSVTLDSGSKEPPFSLPRVDLSKVDCRYRDGE
jgi:hypothetical protein